MVKPCRKHPASLALIAALALVALACASLTGWTADSNATNSSLRSILESFPRVKQLPNYCGPAALSGVLRYWGKEDQVQEIVGKRVYDPRLSATNGADMLLYARSLGFSAASFNGSVPTLKQLLSRGVPVIVLQDTSAKDKSGHFRVVIGYDERTEDLDIFDPYEPERTKMSRGEFADLWLPRGNWGLLVVPAEKDSLLRSINARNPVVHLDLAQAYYRQGKYDEADSEIRLALRLEPLNPSAHEMLSRIERIRGAAGN